MPSSIINALSLCLALGSGVSAWTMAAHDTDKCGASANNFNYVRGSNPIFSSDGVPRPPWYRVLADDEQYSLESDSGSYSGCIAFPSIPSDVDCTFFTNGGDSSGECSQDTFSRATSFTLHDGICNV